MSVSLRACATAVLALLCSLSFAPAAAALGAPSTSDLIGIVTDSATSKPVPGADVVLERDGLVTARTTTDAFGAFRIHNLPAGAYALGVRYLGYHPARQALQLTGTADLTITVRLAAAPIELQTLDVVSSPVSIDTRTGDQTFKQQDFKGSPTQTTSQILQQSIAGAARAPTGEVHIRGQHGEYTYFVDGLPVLAGISGSLNELFDPQIVNNISFQTGGWDAEFGLRNAAIVNVTTRIPTGGFHLNMSGYGGSFGSNGQTVSFSDNIGKFGFFFSGTRQATDMRREPVVADTNANGGIAAIRNYANHGNDLFGFGKIQYVAGANDVINLTMNASRSRFQVPFDSAQGVIDDRQRDGNTFVNLGWNHAITTGRTAGSEFFAGLFYRRGSLDYTPGINDDPTFQFDGYPGQTFNLQEQRSFNVIGTKIDYTLKLSEAVRFRFGTQSSVTRGNENFTTVDANGNAGPSSLSRLNGSDVSFYAQSVLAPSEKFEIRPGLRFDNHTSPNGPDSSITARQLSPRLKVSFFPDPSSTLYAYYGRQFVPTNIEDLRPITSAAQGGVVDLPTVPQRDDFFEVGFVHRFPLGVVLKLDGYYKRSSPGIDDNTVPGSAITTDVNIAEVRIKGIESVIEIRPSGPVSGFLNLALNHAYGFGAVTGGFFPAVPPTGTFDLDHDQRLSAVAGINYARKAFFLSATGIYGTGLTNGVDPTDPTFTGKYGTGLLDFNSAIKVDPSFILNLATGYSFSTGGTVLRPELYIDNVFNRQYLLKGAFFSGASYGRPRSLIAKLSASI